MIDKTTGKIQQTPSTEELLQRVREEARYLELDMAEESHLVEPVFPRWSSAARDFPIKDSYHVNEFTSYDDIEFVVNAYRGILRREPDESGLDTYVARLRERGAAEKIWILLPLLECDEGRAAGVYIEGIGWEKFEYRHRQKRWFNQRWFKRVFLLSRQLQKNNLQDYTRSQENSSRAFAQRVDGFLAMQQTFLDQVQASQKHTGEAYSSVQHSLERYRRDMLLARQDLLAQQRRLNVILDDLQQQVTRSNLPVEKERMLATHADEKLDTFYLAFENECRGDERKIREQLTEYLPRLHALSVLSEEQPLLDIGCGRGEWLGLLRDEGIAARGVDISSVLVDHCQQANLHVALDDAVAYLRGQPAGSLGAISSFHVIEHLPFEVLYSLVEESRRVLVPGGLLIFETPNPENVMVGSHTFYHDPTHRNPVTPTLIDFLLRHLGFSEVHIERLHPYPDAARVIGMDPLTDRINGAFCGAQDFAVFGSKPN